MFRAAQLVCLKLLVLACGGCWAGPKVLAPRLVTSRVSKDFPHHLPSLHRRVSNVTQLTVGACTQFSTENRRCLPGGGLSAFSLGSSGMFTPAVCSYSMSLLTTLPPPTRVSHWRGPGFSGEVAWRNGWVLLCQAGL